jgi:hypothetical protein
LLKANEEKSEEEKKKAVHTDISMCLYLILCLSSERCYCRHPNKREKEREKDDGGMGFEGALLDDDGEKKNFEY